MRTRANGAVIGVGDVDATQEVQVLTADYAARIRARLRRPDPHHHKDRINGFPRQRV